MKPRNHNKQGHNKQGHNKPRQNKPQRGSPRQDGQQAAKSAQKKPPVAHNRATHNQARQYTIGRDDDGIRLDRWFKRHLPQIGHVTIARWARTGQIRVSGARVKPDDRLSTGQVLRIPPGGNATGRAPRPRRELSADEIARAEAMLITQDRAAIVLNKPPGLATQGGSGMKEHVDGLLDAFMPEITDIASDSAAATDVTDAAEEANAGAETGAGLSKTYGPRPRLVHRLDKDTSGVLLVARTPGSAAFFSKRFSGRSPRKIYWALVTGVPEPAEGTIDAPLAKQPGTGGEKMYVDPAGGQPARTRYRVVDRAGNRAAWVELQPLTGRTHQLRVHLAAIGHPIVGDGKYGGPDAFLTGSISRKMHLHARRLIIDHPDGVPLDATAELPEHFAASMAQLGFDPATSDARPDEGPPPPTRETRKRAARAHAKAYRKERRGERRNRTRSKADHGKTGPGKRGPAAKSRPAKSRPIKSQSSRQPGKPRK